MRLGPWAVQRVRGIRGPTNLSKSLYLKTVQYKNYYDIYIYIYIYIKFKYTSYKNASKSQTCVFIIEANRDSS